MIKVGLVILLLFAACAPAHPELWYVDEVDGASPGDGTSLSTAWCSLSTAMSTDFANFAVGNGVVDDTVWVRSLHTEDIAEGDVAVTADGLVDRLLCLFGDDGTIWATDDGTRIASFMTVANSFVFSSDNYWHVRRINFEVGSDEAIQIANSVGLLFENCEFVKPSGNIGYVDGYSGDVITFRNCTFDGGAIGVDDANAGDGPSVLYGWHVFESCSFHDMRYAIYGDSGSRYYLTNCTFGQNGTDGANTYDVYAPGTGTLVYIYGGDLLDNSKFNGAGISAVGNQLWRYYRNERHEPMIYMEAGYRFSMLTDYSTSHDQVEYSLKCQTGNNDYWNSDNMRLPILSVSVPADSADNPTFTCAARRDANWGVADALVWEAVYQDGDTIKVAQSTQELLASPNWQDFTVTLTQNHEGPVRLTLYLTDYDADGVLYIDPLIESTDDTLGTTFHWGEIYAVVLPGATPGVQWPGIQYQMRGPKTYKDGELRIWLDPSG